jgi:H+/gluconate symporter-like permease
MGLALFREGAVPRRLLPAALALGTSTFTMSALPGTPAIQNAIPMPFFGTDPFAAPGLGVIAAFVMFGFGMAWLSFAHRRARARGEGFDDGSSASVDASGDLTVRELASTAREFDPAEIDRGGRGPGVPGTLVAVLPLAVVIVTNLLLSQVVLPRIDASFLAEPRWGGVDLTAVAGVWSVAAALAAGILTLVVLNLPRLPDLRLGRCRRQRFGPADSQRREPCGLRRGRRGAAGLFGLPGLGARD